MSHPFAVTIIVSINLSYVHHTSINRIPIARAIYLLDQTPREGKHNLNFNEIKLNSVKRYYYVGNRIPKVECIIFYF